LERVPFRVSGFGVAFFISVFNGVPYAFGVAVMARVNACPSGICGLGMVVSPVYFEGGPLRRLGRRFMERVNACPSAAWASFSVFGVAIYGTRERVLFGDAVYFLYLSSRQPRCG
jgi:hypothetical protein